MKKELVFTENEDVLSRISTAYDTMSKQHKSIADYVVEHLDKVAYFTVNVLSKETNTSLATVLRFSYLLGYDGYPEFRKAVRNQTKNRLTTLERIHMPGFETYNFDGIKDILRSDSNNIKTTCDELDEQIFTTVVDELINAEKIYILASRTTYMLSEYMGYYLNLLLNGKVALIQDSIREPFEMLMNITQDDVALGLSFPRYSSRTIRYLDYCKKKNATVIGVTDLPSSPIYPLCDHVLFAKSNIISFVDTLVAPLSLINALIIGVGLKNEEETQRVFSELEQLWDEYLTYNQFNN